MYSGWVEHSCAADHFFSFYSVRTMLFKVFSYLLPSSDMGMKLYQQATKEGKQILLYFSGSHPIYLEHYHCFEQLPEVRSLCSSDIMSISCQEKSREMKQ